MFCTFRSGLIIGTTLLLSVCLCAHPGSSQVAQVEPTDGDLYKQANSAISKLIDRLSDKDDQVRSDAVQLLTLLCGDLQRQLEKACLRQGKAAEVAPRISGDLCPTQMIPMFAARIATRVPQWLRSEDVFVEYPFAAALQSVGRASVPEIMIRFGVCDPKQISDKEVELVAQLLQVFFQEPRRRSRDIVCDTRDRKKARSGNGESRPLGAQASRDGKLEIADCG